VELKATVGNGPKSDIAFDNVVVQDGQCQPEKPLAECNYDGGDGCNVIDETCGEESTLISYWFYFKEARLR